MSSALLYQVPSTLNPYCTESVCTCLCRPEANLRCDSSSTTARVTHWPGANKPQESASLCLPSSKTINTCYHTQLWWRFQGSKSGPSANKVNAFPSHSLPGLTHCFESHVIGGMPCFTCQWPYLQLSSALTVTFGTFFLNGCNSFTVLICGGQ